MINPFFSYSLAFAIAIFVYLLGWSDLYPKPSILLFLFLSFTFLFHFICGKRIHKSGAIRFKLLPINHRADLVTLLIYVLWIVEFIYEGGVPLVKIILKQPYNYRLFGVPSLHVFIVTFSSFYTVYLFQVFLSHPSRKIFLLFLVNLLAALLIYSRAMFFFNLTSCLFIYIIFSEKVTIKKIVSISLCLIPLLFLFGVLGSLRVSREAKTPYSNDSFLNTGRATDEFRRSIIPKEYFWAYIYISSPLANLQQNINEYPVAALSPRSIAELFNSEVLPDFISKRINRLFNLKQYEDKRITGPFNVSTVYSRSYSYAGWPGLILMALVIISIPLVLLKILPPSSDFFLSGWVILCTMYLYLSYDNMLRFTGLSLQLAYPILLHCIDRKIPKAVKIK